MKIGFVIKVTLFLNLAKSVISKDFCLEFGQEIIKVNGHLNVQRRISKYEEIKLRTGDNFTLHCVHPQHHVSWHYLSCNESKWKLIEEKTRNGIEHIISLINLNETDAGLYKCSIYNIVLKLYKLIINSKSSVHRSNKNLNQLSYTEVKVKVGDNFTLKCNGAKGSVLEFLLLQPCVPDNNTVCKLDGDFNGNIITLSPINTKNLLFYNKKIKIINFALEQSGFYRCISNGVNITYDIQVTNSKYGGPLPKILEVKSSKLLRNSYITMKCKVYSKLPPSINWLKESDEASCDLKYLDKFYQSVNRSNLIIMPFQENIYYGEITIKIITESENFVCLALTQFGKDYEVLKIDLLKNRQEKRTISLLLFLIPLPLILVPIIVWLCYFKKKKINSGRNIINNELSAQIPLVHKLKTVCGNK